MHTTPTTLDGGCSARRGSAFSPCSANWVARCVIVRHAPSPLRGLSTGPRDYGGPSGEENAHASSSSTPIPVSGIKGY